MSVSIQSLTQDPSAASQASAASSAPGLRDEFMRLFVAQLQHQDPLQPQDNNAFVAQLAQLSQVEQATEANQRLQTIADEQAAAARASLSTLVGHEVTARADSFEVARGGTPPPVRVHLDGAAAKVTVTLVDGAGRSVRTLDLGAQAAGDVTVDPATIAGLAPGSYGLRIDAAAAGGAPVGAHGEITGVIDAMQLAGGSGTFRIGSLGVTPASIISVGAERP
jgi:flagellar basal-body rod modification protein FlgD